MARAKKGGEYGANGEWYEGGKFLNTIPENAKREGSARRRGPRKVEVEPYKWEPARDGWFPILSIVGTQAAWVDRYADDKRIEPHQPGIAYYGETRHGHAVADLCERWNRGERWAEKLDSDC